MISTEDMSVLAKKMFAICEYEFGRALDPPLYLRGHVDELIKLHKSGQITLGTSDFNIALDNSQEMLQYIFDVAVEIELHSEIKAGKIIVGTTTVFITTNDELRRLIMIGVPCHDQTASCLNLSAISVMADDDGV